MKKFNRVAPWILWLLLFPSLVFGGAFQQIINRTMQGAGSEIRLYSDGHYQTVINNSGSFEIDGFMTLTGAPSVSAANQGTFGYNSATQGFQLSANGGAVQPIGGVVSGAASNIGITIPIANFGGTVSNQSLAANNQVRAMQFFIPVATQFDHIIWGVATGQAASNSDFGIYNLGGTTLLADTGPKSTATSAVFVAGVFTQGIVTLQPGYYWFAWTSTNNAVAFAGVPVNPNTATFDFFNTGGASLAYVTCGNPSVSGQLPSTMGTLSAFNGSGVPLAKIQLN